MPLVEAKECKKLKMVPDANGGWYWLKWRNEDWEPVFVRPSTGRGWSASISRYSHTVEVECVDGEWGPQIFPPE